MNDEIKEIDNSDLMELLETTSKKEFYRLILDHELVVRLYNWLTNLQHEKERLKRLAEKDYTELNIAEMNATIYKSRCKNALDKLYCFGEVFDGKILQKFQKEMENILNGGDEE